jgi:outer membrane lipoprotein carrier protein
MPILRLLLLVAFVVPLASCDGAEEQTAAAPNRPVPVWRPDSTPASPAAGDSIRPLPAGGAAVAGGGAGSAPAGEGGATAVAAGPATNPRAGEDSPPASSSSSGGATARPPIAANRAGDQAGDEATRILLRAERAYDAVRTMRAEFVQDLTVPLLESTQRSRGTIYHRKPDRFLMRFSDPAGDVVVADGRYLWLYYPSNDPGQVMRTSMGQAGRIDLQREFLSNPTERFDATVQGSEVVAGRPAKLLRLVPRTQAPYRSVRIWIDDQDALARRFEITESNDAVRIVELRNLQVNADLPDDLFAFTPPAGAQIFEQ